MHIVITFSPSIKRWTCYLAATAEDDMSSYNDKNKNISYKALFYEHSIFILK